MGKRRPTTPLPSTISATLYGAQVDSELDLHGLGADQALRRVRSFLDTWQLRRPGAILRIITGRGNRSSGAPVLLEAVRELLNGERGHQISEVIPDAGGGGWVVRLGAGK